MTPNGKREAPRGPLDGVKVLDFSRVVVGPICTQVLGDMGAEVYKIETVDGGDYSRTFLVSEDHAGESFSFMSLNRNKRSICLDVRQPEGKEIALALVDECDVVVQNFRPGVMTRLGLDYDTLIQRKPDIIYASASGFGQTGPYAGKPGQDMLAQAIGGVAWLNGERDGPPVPSGAIIGDYIAGMLLAQGILAALWSREMTGEGQEVDVALLSGILHLQSEFATAYLNSGQPQAKNTRPINRFYRTGDDKWLALAGTFGATPVRDVCLALGLPDLSQDERFNTWHKANYVNADDLEAVFAERFATKTRDEWLIILEEAGILCAPVHSYAETFADPQVIHNESVVEFDHPTAGRVKGIAFPVTFSKTPADIRLPPPQLGEHTDEILTSLGYTTKRILELREKQIVG
jgi:formyl-CoA transferase